MSGGVVILKTPVTLRSTLVGVSFLVVAIVIGRVKIVTSTSLNIIRGVVIFTVLPPVTVSSTITAVATRGCNTKLVRQVGGYLTSNVKVTLIFNMSIYICSRFLPRALATFFSGSITIITVTTRCLQKCDVSYVVMDFIFYVGSCFDKRKGSLFPVVRDLVTAFLFHVPLSC